MAKIEDDIYDWREVDLEKIQEKPSQYIGELGSVGALHITKETINNAIDECTNEKSPGKIINILFAEKDNNITVKDDGRGIPFDKMEVVCTILQSSTKFTREQSGTSAGENGRRNTIAVVKLL